MAKRLSVIDEYLSAVSADKRAALEKVRKAIRAAAPKAEECISYGLAAFRLNGQPLVAFGATANHCAFFPMDSTTVAAHKEDLEGYETSKGTIRFQADKPLPVPLIRKLVKRRIAENERQVGESRTRKPAREKRPHSRTDPAVNAFVRELKHPLKKDIEAVRKIILGVNPEIREGIKWNSLSFRTSEFFATINRRSEDSVQLVLHKGAKVKDNATKEMNISDPKGLITWLATDRCLATLGAGKEIRNNRAAIETIIREWIAQM